MRLFDCLWVAAALSSCTTLTGTRESDHHDLDIVDHKSGAKSDHQSPFEKDETVKTTSKSSLSPEAVSQWQNFFKAPPSQAQRKLLDQRITAWKDTQSPDDLVKRARAEGALGRFDAAESSVRQALRQDRENHAALLELANLYLRKKDLPNTFQILAEIKEQITASETVAPAFLMKYRYTLALAYIERGDIAKGHDVLSDLIGQDRSFAPAYATLASSYLELGKDQVAEFVTRRGMDRVQDSPALLNIMGLIAQRSGQYEMARTWFDKALAASPTFSPALVNRAVVSSHFLEYGAAEEDLMAAVQSDPTSVDALIVLAHVQKKQGHLRGAKASLAKALDLEPMNAFARFNMGVLLADDLKNPSEALRLFREVLQTQKAPPDLRETTTRYIRDLGSLGKF